jgi:oligopeptide transport system substrate-binding protein
MTAGRQISLKRFFASVASPALGVGMSCTRLWHNWLGVILVLFAGGCVKHDAPVVAATASATLLLGNGAEPADFDPPVATAYTDMNILNALFEGLTFIDERTSQPVPAAAERWETSADGLTWTFHLRGAAAWSNGEPVVADDFVQSFRRVVSPKMAFENASYLFALKNAEALNSGRLSDLAALGCAAPDAHTLVLTLERPTPTLPLLTALTPWFPINPRVLERFDAMRSRGTPWTRAGNLVGNGAFLLKEWTPNSRVVVVKNPHYWDAAHTELNELQFFPIENPDAEERAFRAGQLHLTFTLPVTRIAGWREQNPAELRVDPFLQTVFVMFNAKRKPFDDPRVRRAFALAIDRATIAKAALGGVYPPAYAATPPNTGGFTAEARAGYDVAQARALLREAGHADGRGLTGLSLDVRNAEPQPVVAEALQAMWRDALGIEVAILPHEQKTWLQNQRTLNYTLSTYSWVGDFPDPSTFLGLFTSENGNNWTGWSDPAYDRIIATAAVTSAAEERNRLFQQAESLLLAQSPLTPVYHGVQTYLIRPEVHDWQPALLGFHRYQRVRLAR